MNSTPQIPDPTPTVPTPSGPIAAQIAACAPKLILQQGKLVARELKKFAKRNPGVIVEIEGKLYPCIEAWQFVAACYEHTPLIAQTIQQTTEKGDELGFVAIAHLANQTGRIVSGAESACLRSEDYWAPMPSFQLRSMAQTRACARVCRNIFAWIMILADLSPTPAEEMGYAPGKSGSSQMTGKKCYECGNQVSDALYHKTRKKFGKALCLECEKKENDSKEQAIMNVVNDPALIEKSIAQVKERKAAQGQPIVKALEEEWEDEPKQVNGWRDR